MRKAIVIVGCAIACAFGAGVSACATGTAGDSTAVDSGSHDGTIDAPKSDGGNGNCPTGYTGPTCQNCAGGFHQCGTSCEQDHPNTPDAGCTLGCNNTACPAPPNAVSKCTTDGHCDFACATSFDKTDGGCECPPGEIVCGQVCQQCCTDTDCVGHQVCTNGTCGGCQPGWGDCNNNTSDGCETHLNSTSNCGSCGHSCCSGLCCGLFGLSGSENCNVSGNSFSCGC